MSVLKAETDVNRHAQTQLVATLAHAALDIVWQMIALGVMVSTLIWHVDIIVM